MVEGNSAGSDEFESTPRSTIARVGIVALNLILPGLGLVRVGLARAGLGLILASFALSAIVALAMATLPEPSRSAYLTCFAVLTVLTLAAYTWSMLVSWRASRMIAARPGQLWRWFAIIGIAAIAMGVSQVILSLIHGSYRTFYMTSSSMEPTLLPGDRFVAHMRKTGPLLRGDLVIVTVGSTEYSKRIVGLPGDRVALNNGIVVLNGTPIAQHPDGNYRAKDSTLPEAAQSSEQFPGEDRPHSILDLRAWLMDELPEVVLPEQTYFLLGDNRDNSLDSRVSQSEMGLGLVSRERIIGKVLFRLW